MIHQAVLLLANPKQGHRFTDAERGFPVISRGLAAGHDEILDNLILFEGSIRLSGLGKGIGEF